MNPSTFSKKAGNLNVTTPGEREIAITRVFDAPRRLVFDALTKPELLKRWLFGPSGWELAVCEIDLKIGGRYRYVWRKPGVPDMGAGGVYREVLPPERLVATEKFDQAWYPGEALVTQELAERAGKTTLVMTLQYESREARDGVLKSPMDEGVGASFDRLARLLPEL